MSNLVFYDGSCGLCDKIVQFILSQDKKRLFLFAPLQGETAKKVLKNVPSDWVEEDTLILVENYQQPNEQFYVLGKAALRILWILNGGWKLIGWISFLPAFLYNWIYRLAARNRHRFFTKQSCILPSPKGDNRFLP